MNRELALHLHLTVLNTSRWPNEAEQEQWCIDFEADVPSDQISTWVNCQLLRTDPWSRGSKS